MHGQTHKNPVPQLLLQSVPRKAVNYTKYAWTTSEPSLCAKSATGLLILLTNKFKGKHFISNSQDSLFLICEVFHRYKKTWKPLNCLNATILSNKHSSSSGLFAVQALQTYNSNRKIYTRTQEASLRVLFPRPLSAATFSSSLQPHISSATA